jgi:hypothetical protein
MQVATARRPRGALGAGVIATLLMVIVACSGGGATPSAPPIPGRALAGTTSAVARSVALTSDGGTIIVGTSSAGGLGGTDVLLVKLGAGGNILWSSVFGGAGADEGWSVQQTVDGGFILAGVTDDPGLAGGPGGILLVKTDDAGRPEWQETLAGLLTNAPFFQADSATSVVQRADGGFVVVGSTASFGAASGIYLLRLDGDGVAE